MIILSHARGIFVSQRENDLNGHLLEACKPLLMRSEQQRLIVTLASGGRAGDFQGGRFVLGAGAGPVCAARTRKRRLMDRPVFLKTLAAWGLPETLFDGIDPHMQPLLWNSLLTALEPLDSPLAGWKPAVHVPATPLPFIYQHLARPCFQQKPLCRLDMAGWHRALRLALWMAAEALETLRAQPKAEVYRTLLCEQCAWMGQLYADLKGWAGPYLAPMIVQGELRFLMHRASAAVTDLLLAA